MLLGMYEDAQEVLMAKLAEWEEEDNKKLLFAYKKLIDISDVLQDEVATQSLRQKLCLNLGDKQPAKASLLIALYGHSSDSVYIESAERIIRGLRDAHALELDLLSKKFVVSRDARFRDECLSLFLAVNSSRTVSSDEEEEFSYFANRKPSRTLQKLVGNSMVMQSRKTGEGLNLRVRRSTAQQRRRNNTRKKLRSTKADDAFVSSASEDAFTPRNIHQYDLDDFVEIGSEKSTSEADDPQSGYTDYSSYRSGSNAHQYHEDHPQIDTRTTIEVPFKSPPIPSNPTYAQKHIRIAVECGPYELLVPCVDDDISSRKTVRWLIDEIARRCLDLYNSRPEITRLQLKGEGISLFEADPVTDVFADNQRVYCVVAGWTRQSPVDQYRKRNGADKSIIKRLSASNSTALDLSCLDVEYEHEHCMALFSCLKTVHELDLSDNLLNDRAVSLLCQLLVNGGPCELRRLDLSGNCIEGATIVELFRVAPMLSEMDLSFNPLSKSALDALHCYKDKVKAEWLV